MQEILLRGCLRAIVLVSLVALAQGDCASNTCADGVIPWSEYWQTQYSVSSECDYSSTASTTLACAAGQYLDTGTCAEACSAGHYCPAGYTSLIAFCEAGSYCSDATTQVTCSAGTICPEGSYKETACSPMSFCYSSGASSTLVLDYVFWLFILPWTVYFALNYALCPCACSLKKRLMKRREPKGDDTKENEDDGESLESNKARFQRAIADPLFPEVFGRRGVQIKWDDLGVRLTGKHVLKHISGTVAAGSITAIMGPSGAGKTTLLRTIAGLQRESYGTISRDDSSSTHGFVHQFNAHYASLTVNETLVTLTLLDQWRSIGRNMLDFNIVLKKVRLLANIVGLGKVLHSLVGTAARPVLSGGEAKRLAIAREMIKNPNVIILDEPTSGLDDSTSHALLKFLRSLSICGKTVLLTIHQPRFSVWQNLTRIYILASVGRVFYEGSRLGLIPYMNMLGFECPFEVNPADFVMDVVSGRVDRVGGKPNSPDHLCDIWLAVCDQVETLAVSKYGSLKNTVDELDEAYSRQHTLVDMGRGDADRIIRHMRSQAALQDKAKGYSTMAHSGKAKVGGSMWKVLGALAQDNLVIDLDYEDKEISYKRASWWQGCCGLQKHLVHTLAMLCVNGILVWRERSLVIVQVFGMAAVGLALGIVFWDVQLDNVIFISSATIIPISLLGTLSTQIYMSTDMEIGMREYLLDFGLSRFAYITAKNLVLKGVLTLCGISFVVWSDFGFGLSLKSNIGTYFAVVMAMLLVCNGYSMVVASVIKPRQALLIMVAIAVASLIFCGGAPTLNDFDAIFNGFSILIGINHGRWYNELLFLNRAEFWLDSPAWNGSKVLYWTNRHSFYESNIGTAWGVMVAFLVFSNSLVYVVFIGLGIRNDLMACWYRLRSCRQSKKYKPASAESHTATLHETTKTA